MSIYCYTWRIKYKYDRNVLDGVLFQNSNRYLNDLDSPWMTPKPLHTSPILQNHVMNLNNFILSMMYCNASITTSKINMHTLNITHWIHKNKLVSYYAGYVNQNVVIVCVILLCKHVKYIPPLKQSVIYKKY